MVFRKESKNQNFILNFRPLRTYFEEEAATSTTSAMHQWKALVKPAFDHQITEFDHEYLILITRFTEILVPKQEYRVRTGAEYSVRCPSFQDCGNELYHALHYWRFGFCSSIRSTKRKSMTLFCTAKLNPCTTKKH